MEKDWIKSLLWYSVFPLLFVMAVAALISSNRVEVLSYSEFKTLLKAGKLSKVAVQEQEISGTIKDGDLGNLLPKEKIAEIKRIGGSNCAFSTVRIADPALVQDLDAAKIEYAGELESHFLSNLASWILPTVIFIVVWFYAMRRLGGGASPGKGLGIGSGMLEIGKSHAKVYMDTQPGVTFDDVAGIDEAKEELIEIVQFLKDPNRFRRLGGKIPKGVLIVGAPGTGKTLLAKAVAGEANVPFFSISGSEFVEMFVGVGAARVRDLFMQAEEKAPCIVFIDEIDALGKARSAFSQGGQEEREQTLNQLLVQMDGFDTNKGIIILAATNRPEILDPALLRPGRFDRHIAIDRPDLNERQKILAVHAKHVLLAPGLDLRDIAAKTAGFAGADLANLVNEAALLAARRDKNSVELTDFDEALDRIVGGPEKKNRVMNAMEKETTSYHEAGHALIAEFREHTDPIGKISIIPRGIATLGYTQQTPTEDRYLLKRSELLDRLDVLLGGRAAEEIVFGDVSTGAQNDLQRATDMARQMITQYGMSESLGLPTYERGRSALFLTESTMPAPRDFSEATAQAIDEESRKLLAEAYARVRQTLTEHRSLLNALAAQLLEKEIVDRADLDALLANHKSAGEARPLVVAN